MIGFIERPEIRDKLLKAADEGIPPVMAISGDALAAFPPATFDDQMNKRRLGLLVAATLDEMGYEPARSNVRIKNPVFSSGSIYKRKSSAPIPPDGLVSRLAATLNEQEAEWMIDAIIDRFPSLGHKLRR